LDQSIISVSLCLSELDLASSGKEDRDTGDRLFLIGSELNAARHSTSRSVEADIILIEEDFKRRFGMAKELNKKRELGRYSQSMQSIAVEDRTEEWNSPEFKAATSTKGLAAPASAEYAGVILRAVCKSRTDTKHGPPNCFCTSRYHISESVSDRERSSRMQMKDNCMK
jgi:hypothetical protein